MAAFRQLALDHFTRQAFAHLLPCFPNLREEEAANIVRRAISTGRQLGITTESDVTQLSDIMMRTSIDVDRDPELSWIMEILQDRSRPVRARLEAVLERLTND